MSGSFFLRAAHWLETRFDRIKRGLQGRLRGDRQLHVVPYVGHGTRRRLIVRGRVLRGHNVRPPSQDDSIWRNLLNMMRRFNTAEVPRARVTFSFNDLVTKIRADDEGFFRALLDLPSPLPSDHILHVVELTAHHRGDSARTYAEVIVPPPGAQFGVISDIDDTVIRSDVTNLLKLVRNTFLRNAHTRLPFPGVAAFYHALQQGTRGTFNPIFYVSNNPWNLYDVLVDFFAVRGIPPGPLFLRDLGLTQRYPLADANHKINQIRSLMALHPGLPFILIGDSGEHDADIYLQAVRDYPQRVLCVYIRDVHPGRSGTRRDRHVWEVAEQVRAAGSEMLLVPDTSTAARHAVKHGYIDERALDLVDAATAEDRRPETVVGQLLNWPDERRPRR